jgi:hypothetical protein
MYGSYDLQCISFSALTRLGNYRRFYTISFANLKNPLNGILVEVMPLLVTKCTFTFTKLAHVIPKCKVYLLSR